MARVDDFMDMRDLTGIGMPEVPTIGRYRFARARGGLESHRHEGAFELCWLLEGRQSYRVGGRDWLLNAGDVFATRPDERHDSAERPQEIAALRWLQIRPPRRGKGMLSLDAAAAADLVRRLRALPRVWRAPPGVAERFTAAFAAIDANDRLAVGVILSGLLIDTCAAAGRAQTTAETELQSVLAFIDANLHRPLPIAELAHVAAMTPAWFKTRFRAAIGQAPAHFVMRRRIDAALERLRAGQAVTRVALDLGFSSSQHFATTVKRWTGKTPSEVVGKG